jgi:RimJ/RimL family protein N-acetyltransferase
MGLDRLTDIEATRLTRGGVRLEYLADRHRDALRAACAADPDIWDIYPYTMLGASFDAQWARLSASRTVFAVTSNDHLVGMTSYLNVDAANAVTETGGTYVVPAARGGHVNPAMKRLMLGNAFDLGARRVEFRVDAINLRSRAAVEKLGAQLDGVLRQNRVTWTGRVRDTCVYSILVEEWPAVRDRLEARLGVSAEQA